MEIEKWSTDKHDKINFKVSISKLKWKNLFKHSFIVQKSYCFFFTWMFSNDFGTKYLHKMISIAPKWLYEYRIRTTNEANRISSIYNNTCTMHSPHLRTLFNAVEQNIYIYSIVVITQITIVARFRSSFVFIFIIMTLSIYAFVISYRFNRALFCLFQAQLHTDTHTHIHTGTHLHLSPYYYSHNFWQTWSACALCILWVFLSFTSAIHLPA